MAQGAIKKLKAPAAPKRILPEAHVETEVVRSSLNSAKKGHRVIKPKKEALIKKNKINQKFSAALTAKTEKNLAEKAGHLEMLKGGKKDKPRAVAKASK